MGLACRLAGPHPSPQRREQQVQGITFLPLSLDEKIALALFVVALAGIIHGFAYTAAEGAAVLQRAILRRSADAMAVVAAYVVLRVWS